MSAAYEPDDVIAIAPHFRLQWEEAQQGHVLLYPEGMVRLNETAAEILLLCAQSTSFGSLLRTMRDRYPEAELEPDLREFLGEAAAHGWIRIERP